MLFRYVYFHGISWCSGQKPALRAFSGMLPSVTEGGLSERTAAAVHSGHVLRYDGGRWEEHRAVLRGGWILSRRALALIVTFQVRRYRKTCQFWLLTLWLLTFWLLTFWLLTVPYPSI